MMKTFADIKKRCTLGTAIGEAAARSGPIDEEKLLDDVEKAREEYHRMLAEGERAVVAH
jgi:hypothetical protein